MTTLVDTMKGRIDYSHFLTKSEETDMSAALQEACYENTTAVYMAVPGEMLIIA